MELPRWDELQMPSGVGKLGLALLLKRARYWPGA